MKAAGVFALLTLASALWIPAAYSQQPAQTQIGVLRLSSSTPSSGNQQLQLFDFTGPTNCDQVTYTVCDNLTITNWTLVVKLTDAQGPHTLTFTGTAADNIAPYDKLQGPYTGQANNPWTFDESCTSGTCPPFDTVITQVTFTGTIGSANPTLLNVHSSGNTSSFFASPTFIVQYTPQGATSDGGVVVYDPTPLLVSAATAPSVALSANTLDLGSVWLFKVGQSSVVTITNAGTASLHIQSIVPTSSSFRVQSGTCVSAVVPGGTCSFSVALSPNAQGPASGTIAINSDAPSSPDSISVNGQGIDLALTLGRPGRPTRNDANLVKIGETAEFPLELASNAIGESVSLICSNPPPGTTCSVDPSQLVLGSGSETATILLATRRASGELAQVAGNRHGLYTMTVTARAGGGTRSIAVPIQLVSEPEESANAGALAKGQPARAALPLTATKSQAITVSPNPPAPSASVGSAPIAVKLRVDRPLSRAGEPVTFLATVQGGGDLAQREITFRSGDQLLGKGRLDENGTASFTTSLLPVGKHSITAVYTASPKTPEVSSQTVVHTVRDATAAQAPTSASKGKDRP